jgi:hypothetical protein
MPPDRQTSGLLVIVSPGHLYVVNRVQRHFKSADRVEVIIDRRRGQRRAAAAPVPGDRRAQDRRQQDISAELALIGWTIVRRHPTRPLDPTRPWHLPWLRVELMLRMLLGSRWGVQAWPTAQAAFRGALRARSKIRREGWFN